MAIALLIIVAGLYTWATWRYFTSRVPGGNDFLAHYTAWEAYLKQGRNPYSDEAALYTQQAIYGRPALPGEDQNRLTYPFYSILIHGPFVVLDYPVARALYMTLLEAALFAGVALSLDLLRWRPPAWLLAVLLAWSLLFYPEARGVILGQFAIFGFFALASALYGLAHGREVEAGALLVLATVKPTLIFLVVPYLLVWAATRQRWRFVASFGGVLAALVAGSLIALPTWIGDWLYRVGQYSSYTAGQSPAWLVAHQVFPGLGQPGEWALTGLLLAVMLIAWRWAIRNSAAFHWSLGVTLVVSNLIVPRSATTNYVLMLIPTLMVFAALDRAGRIGRLALLGLLLVSFIGLWWLHLSTVVGNQEQSILFFPWPLALGLALWFGRRWLVREAQAARLWPHDTQLAQSAVPASASV